MLRIYSIYVQKKRERKVKINRIYVQRERNVKDI